MRSAISRSNQRVYSIGSTVIRKNVSIEDVAKSCFSPAWSSSSFDDSHSSSRDDSRSKSTATNLNFIPSSRHTYYNISDQCHSQHRLMKSTQTRSMSSWLPEAVQNFSIWGGSGWLLKTLHMDGTIPYWACFALINFILRTALAPLVLFSAYTSARFAKVSPEIQFIVTLFQNDLKKMREENKSLVEKRFLFLQNMQTIRSIYKLHNINPLTVFMSPFLQIPFFYYVAIDLRKIVNGADPALAQQLTESNFWWITDLTSPDPWFGLPIAAGAMLYWNVESAIGKRSLSGPTAAKSDFGGLLKDAFQTLAVFMPCFVSQSPAGIQIYLVSSFTFTLFQGAVLRSDPVRDFLGLPSMGSAPTEPKYAKEFMEFKKLEQKAREIRGDGPILGRNVLAVGFETSFPGTNRPSTIEGSGIPPYMEQETAMPAKPKMSVALASATGPFIHGISAPPKQLEAQMAEQMKEQETKEAAEIIAASEREYLAQPPEGLMVAANKGVIMAPPEASKIPDSINPQKFKKTKEKGRKR